MIKLSNFLTFDKLKYYLNNSKKFKWEQEQLRVSLILIHINNIFITTLIETKCLKSNNFWLKSLNFSMLILQETQRLMHWINAVTMEICNWSNFLSKNIKSVWINQQVTHKLHWSLPSREIMFTSFVTC